VSHSGSLVSFDYDIIDEFTKPKALGNTKQGCDSSYLKQNCLGSLRLCGICSFDNGVEGTEVLMPDDSGIVLNPCGFCCIVMVLAFLGLFD